MPAKKTMQEVIEFVAEEFEAARVRNAQVDKTQSSAYLQVRRSFAVEGAIALKFVPDAKAKNWQPKLTVNFPACNKGLVEATAFLHLVTELVPLAASIQAQVDEFEVCILPGEG